MAQHRCRVIGRTRWMFSQAGPAALRAGRAVARPAARWGQAGVVRAASQGAPTTMTPEADMSRLGVADLCDKFHPESVDTVVEKNVQILEPGFRWAVGLFHHKVHCIAGRRNREHQLCFVTAFYQVVVWTRAHTGDRIHQGLWRQEEVQWEG